ncbi:MAG: hypothetical protein FJ299_04080 [Planctomycetes bacterium]|nr:hypothetical protein [Planctomycetota bacterium]
MSSSCSVFRGALEQALASRSELSLLAFHAHLADCADCRTLLEEERALDLLLAQWPKPAFDDARIGQLLLRLARERTQEREHVLLDGLLDRAGAVTAPAGLAQRVLAGLASERSRPSPVRRVLRAWQPLAAAAALVLSLLLWRPWGSAGKPIPQAPPSELLSMLDLLESLELLQGSELDLLLSELPDDELELLQYSDGESSGNGGEAPRSNG